MSRIIKLPSGLVRQRQHLPFSHRHTRPAIFFPPSWTYTVYPVTEKIFTLGNRNHSPGLPVCFNLITSIPRHSKTQALWAQLVLQPLDLPLHDMKCSLTDDDLLFPGGPSPPLSALLHTHTTGQKLQPCPQEKCFFPPWVWNQLQVALCGSWTPTESLGCGSSTCCYHPSPGLGLGIITDYGVKAIKKKGERKKIKENLFCC